MIVKINNKTILERLIKADNFWLKLKGLMGRKDMEDEEGLLLVNCSSVHCFFMKFTIDVVYLDKKCKVIGIETIRPFGIGKVFTGACHVLEMKEGKGKCFKIGDVITIASVLKGEWET